MANGNDKSIGASGAKPVVAVNTGNKSAADLDADKVAGRDGGEVKAKVGDAQNTATSIEKATGPKDADGNPIEQDGADTAHEAKPTAEQLARTELEPEANAGTGMNSGIGTAEAMLEDSKDRGRSVNRPMTAGADG